MNSDKTMTLSFASSLTDLCSINSSFDSAVLRVAYHGNNRNGSSISKETFERCLPTIYNVPVVCHYDSETDSIGGHDVKIKRGEDGAIKVINITDPVGVVPSEANTWWGEVEEEDGTVHEYLYTNVLIWKRQEAYEKIKADGVTSHSMEITIKDGEIIDGVFHIYDFEFKALCLIGVTPCFESSSLEFSENAFSSKFSEMMRDLKEIIKDVTTPKGDDNTPTQKSYTEGGKGILDEKMQLAEKYGIDVSTLDFSIEELSIDELTEKFEAMASASKASDPDGSSAEDDSFALTTQIIDEIRTALKKATYVDRWNEVCQKYFYVDSDIEAMEVYAWDEEDWLLYGFSFSAEGDSISIDFSSKKRKKYAIVDFDEGDQPSPFIEVFNSMADKIDSGLEWESKYNEEHSTNESLSGELSELRAFKQDIEATEAAEARNELFSQFADLNGVEAFEALRESSDGLELDALEDKLFELRGRNMKTTNFSLDQNKPPKIMVDKTNHTDEPYGGIVEKYNKQ